MVEMIIIGAVYVKIVKGLGEVVVVWEWIGDVDVEVVGVMVLLSDDKLDLGGGRECCSFTWIES